MVPDMQQGRPYLPIAALMLLVTPTLAILEALAAAAGGGYRGHQQPPCDLLQHIAR